MDDPRTSIQAVLGLIRARPGYYEHTPSIECLSAFLSRWFLVNGDRAADEDVWTHFTGYVARRFGTDETVSWQRAILYHAAHSYEAYRLFFELFDEAMSEREAMKTNCGGPSQG